MTTDLYQLAQHHPDWVVFPDGEIIIGIKELDRRARLYGAAFNIDATGKVIRAADSYSFKRFTITLNYLKEVIY